MPNRAALRSLGVSPKREVEAPTGHPPSLCSLSTQHSLHNSKDSSSGAPTGFSFFIINIQVSRRPGCLIQRNKLGIAFDTGAENTPREFRETQRAQFPNRTQTGTHKQMKISAQMHAFYMHTPRLREEGLPCCAEASSLGVKTWIVFSADREKCRKLHSLDTEWPAPHSPPAACERLTGPSSGMWGLLYPTARSIMSGCTAARHCPLFMKLHTYTYTSAAHNRKTTKLLFLTGRPVR